MKNKEKKIRYRDVQDVLELIGGRWRGAILATLCDSPKRFSEIKTDLVSVTSRVLTKELRYLEDNLMVKKEVNTVAGNSVVYSLTEHGKSIEILIIQIHEWAVAHRSLILGKLSRQD
jgi:DNA-binding HxlR family transcriptional regulator